jgi:hypothetical protein
MQQTRDAIFADIASLLGTLTTTFKTVIRTHTPLDISLYHSWNLPLVEVREPAEKEHTSLTSMRQEMELDSVLRVYFVQWGVTPDATYTAMVKAIRNLFGAHFTLDCTAVGAWITSVGPITGEMPLYTFEMNLQIRYYLDAQDV